VKIRFLNAIFGAMYLDLISNLDLSEMNFNGVLSSPNNSLFSMYKKFSGYIDLNKLKVTSVIIKKNGKKLREFFSIKNNTLYNKGVVQGAPISAEKILIINNYIKGFQGILKYNNFYYYGGAVAQGKVLKEDIMSLWNLIQPNPHVGHTVLGIKVYLKLKSIVLKPKMDLNRLPDKMKSQFKNLGITSGQEDLNIYIDQLSAHPTFWKQTVGAKILNKVGTVTTWKLEILSNTVFYKTSTN
jgi:hypothetical protein